MADLFAAVFEQCAEPAALVSGAGQLVAVNRAWEQLLGWPRDEIIGCIARDLDLWIDRDERDRATAAVEAGATFAKEMRLRLRDGTCVEQLVTLARIDHDGDRLVLLRLHDNRERTRELEKLSLSEARLRALTVASFEGIAMSEGGTIIDCNDQLAAIFGYPLDELRGMQIARLAAPEQREMVSTNVATGFEGPYEHVGLRKDGSTMPVEIRARMVQHQGRWIRLSAVRDLTEQQRATQEMKRLIAELEARTDEMEQFVHTVSHDLKSPLVTIKGFLGAIAADLAAGRNARVARDMQRVSNAADRMTDLLDDLLELSRVGRVGTVASRVDLGQVAANAVELVRGMLDARGVAVVIGALPTVTGDRGRLLQVFQNLVENACKYMGDQKSPRITIGARDVTGRAVVFVEDNGIGIAQEHAHRVFNLFEKLDPKSPGTGVGLALAKRIVEFHGGTIRVESEGRGRGSRFVVDIPLESPTSA
jgi:PAS domain S-box-containing protein